MALKKEVKTLAKKAVKTVKAVAKPVAKAAVKTAAKATTKSTAKKSSEVEFKVYSPDSRSVAIAGDFNNWKPKDLKKGKDGSWTGKFTLASGEHQYKIVYDGQYWQADHANQDAIADGHGGINSIKRV